MKANQNQSITKHQNHHYMFHLHIKLIVLIVFSTRWDVVKPSKSLRLYTIVSGWLAWLAGWLGSWLAGWLGCLAWLAGWLAGWAVWPGWLAGWAGLAGWLAWLGPCWAGKGGLGTVSGCPGPVLLSGIYPGSIRDSRAGLGWAVLRLAGLAWPCHQQNQKLLKLFPF